jgi:hypothetical protein
MATLNALMTEWKARLEPVLCGYCDWRYMIPAGSSTQRCPHCFRRDLVPLDVREELTPFPHRPEYVLPFTVTGERVAKQVSLFTHNIPFAPADLTPQNLRKRLRRVYLPHWLVDAEVEAQLQAEVGFDYQVVSHRERYASGQWVTQEVRETRIRWEHRVGDMVREYYNVPVPALENDRELVERLGTYPLEEMEDYRPEHLDRSFVHLPDRSPEDAWADAVPAIQQQAADEIRQAADAQHVRDFSWRPDFGYQEWTQLLRPLYATYYLDDDQQPRPVLIHGQTGRLSGERRASTKRARRMGFIIGGVGLFFVLVAVGLGLADLFVAEGLGLAALLVLLLAAAILIGALVPPFIAWEFNRRQDLQ